MNDIEKLSLVSETAREFGNNYDIVDISDYQENLSFHPNGKSGCIISKDDYIFGIRCCYLMWAEGFCEGNEGFWTDNDQSFRAILIYGNHKGSLRMRLIIFHD